MEKKNLVIGDNLGIDETFRMDLTPASPKEIDKKFDELLASGVPNKLKSSQTDTPDTENKIPFNVLNKSALEQESGSSYDVVEDELDSVPENMVLDHLVEADVDTVSAFDNEGNKIASDVGVPKEELNNIHEVMTTLRESRKHKDELRRSFKQSGVANREINGLEKAIAQMSKEKIESLTDDQISKLLGKKLNANITLMALETDENPEELKRNIVLYFKESIEIEKYSIDIENEYLKSIGNATEQYETVSHEIILSSTMESAKKMIEDWNTAIEGKDDSDTVEVKRLKKKQETDSDLETISVKELKKRILSTETNLYAIVDSIYLESLTNKVKSGNKRRMIRDCNLNFEKVFKRFYNVLEKSKYHFIDIGINEAKDIPRIDDMIAKVLPEDKKEHAKFIIYIVADQFQYLNNYDFTPFQATFLNFFFRNIRALYFDSFVAYREEILNALVNVIDSAFGN